MIDDSDRSDGNSDRWHHWRCLSHHAGSNGGREAHLLPASWTDISRSQMESTCPSVQRLGDWTGQNIRLLMRASTHRPGSTKALPIPLGFGRFRGRKSFRPGSHLPPAVQAAERSMEPEGKGHLFLSARRVHRRLHQLW